MTSSRVGVTLKTRAAKGPARCGCEVRKVPLKGQRSLWGVSGFRGVGTGCAAGRPLQGIKAGVAEVLPCKDCSRAAADDKTPSPRNEEAVSCGGRAGKDDGEGVAPGRPVGCVAVGVGATQAEPAEPLGSWAARSVCGEAEAYRNSHLSRFIPILQCYMCMRSGKSKTAERRRGCSSLRARKAPSIAPCEACMIERANGINGEDGGV